MFRLGHVATRDHLPSPDSTSILKSASTLTGAKGAGMADGQFGQAPPGESVDDSPSHPIAKFLKTRNGLLTALAIAAGLGLALTVLLSFSPMWGLHLVRTPFLSSPDSWLWFATATCLLWLPLALLTLDPPDNMATGPRLLLPLVTLGIMAGLTAACVAFKPALDAAFKVRPGDTELHTIFTSAPLATLFAFLAVALVVRISNAGLFAAYAMAQFRTRQEDALKASAGDIEVKQLIKEVEAYKKEQGNAEALSAVIATTAVILVVTLALVVGGWNGSTHIGTDVGLVFAGIILGIFAVVFLLEWLAELPPVRALSRAINGASEYFAFLAIFYNFVDLLLVRIGAQVAGAGHNNPLARYAILGGTQLCLAAMTWFLPDPLGLITAFLGFTLALSVARLWAWVEEDRHLALITQFKANSPRRIGFKEDYRDEAIFGFIFVLALIPMALKQADAGQLFNFQYFTGANHNDPVPWIVYFSLELAKALPIVSWADIYLQQVKFDTLLPTHPWGQHATFLARALVDLVLVSSLLQAISITLRNRQQKALYASRQIHRLDELVERGEIKKAVARNEAEWFTRGLDFRHYDQERLRELHADTTDTRRKRFIERIFEQGASAVGYAIEVLEKLAMRRARPEELEQALSTVRAEHETGKHGIDPMDLHGVFEHLRGVEGLKAFKLKLIDFAEEIDPISLGKPPMELAELLENIIFDSRRDQFQYTRIHAAKLLTRIVPRLADPSTVSGMLAHLKAARSEIFGANKYVPEFLERAPVTRLQEIGPPAI